MQEPQMSELETVKLFGNLLPETAHVVLKFNKRHDNGFDVAVSFNLLEYTFCVETFFFGFNLKMFIKEAEQFADGQPKMAKLFNYDETITLEFIRLVNGTEFVSMSYRSIFPDHPSVELLADLRKMATLSPAAEQGTRFAMSFMLLHTGVSECARLIGDIVTRHTIDTSNPYTFEKQ